MDVVFVCSITGQNIRQCIQHACQQRAPSGAVLTNSENGKPFCLEDYLQEAANLGHDSLSTVLAKPETELLEIADDAVHDLATTLHHKSESDSRKYNVAFVTLHPVLYHGETKSFISPYRASSFSDSFEDKNINISSFISIHDDIFDIHKRLTGYRKLFDISLTRDPKKFQDIEIYPRNPEKDITQQRLLLDWRDRELSTSRILASELQRSHYLFHQKGYLDTFWDIAVEGRPAVYYSHPISQPRRDWTRTSDPEKCKEPDPKRGDAFEENCQSFANELVETTNIPLIDPAHIDELRIDEESVSDFEPDEHNAVLLPPNAVLLPPLSKRWTVGESALLLDPDASSTDRQTPFIKTPEFNKRDQTFRLLSTNENNIEEYVETIDSSRSHHIRGSISILEDEISRQIKVRDYILTYQSRMTIVFRPYVLPDSHKATGGVSDEVEAISRKKELGIPMCSPAAIILHPLSDEKRRRANAFDAFWNGGAEEYLGEEYTSDESLEGSILRVVKEADYSPDTEKAREDIEKIFKTNRVTLKGTQDDSSLSGTDHKIAESRLDSFFEDLFIKSHVFEPDILKIVKEQENFDESDMMLIEDDSWNVEVHDAIQNAMMNFSP